MKLSGKTCRGVLATMLAGGMLLTAGCGAGGSQSDRSNGSNSKGGGGYSGPLPAPAQPTSAAGADKAEGEQKDMAPTPTPDYLSTFALDVDTASYGYARRTLADGRLPEAHTVRPEEFVNSFRQDYERPDGNGFTVTVDGARTGDDDWSLVRVGLATRGRSESSERPPAALTFVVDISGSMAESGRLDLVRDALGVLTDQLRDDDSIAIVTFSDRAETRLPMTRVEGRRDRIHHIVDSLEPTDSTNVEAGVRTGYDVAVEGHRKGATNRVVLLSDALANTGETSADKILKRIDGARREYGITLFGVGVGSDYGDALMERLADKGDGHTTYVSTRTEARKLFCDQLPANIELTARDAKAQVAFDPQTVEQFRLIGYDNRKVADKDFRNDRVDGGEVGPGHTVTALYAVRLRAGATGHMATATVRWQDPSDRSPHEQNGMVETETLKSNLWNETSTRLQVTAVAAYFADELRGRSLPSAPTLTELSDRAAKLATTTEDAQVKDLATAIREANNLKT
ncbi:vWA domain-containing protein [Streptomyces sp. NBC_01465]|uniref:vWA domain-containing protein n=1 Tax=Streptomyces sp. NBC_01465 TaxID=2903878 RepID=UPI002E3632AF|nr:von Willebrand factor type A domain-containing protein [Streptomyces sp. NBC_01465]